MNFFKEDIFFNIKRKSLQHASIHICVRRDIRKTAITSVLKDSIYLKHRMNKKIFNTQKSKDQTLLFSSLKQLTSYRCEITAYSKMTNTC